MISTIKIGAIHYAVELKPDLHYEDNEGRKRHLNGQVLHDSAVIRVENELSTDMQIATLWHEVLHGILTVAGHDEQPENLIIPLGYGLVSVIRDNPDLVELTLKLSSKS